ncbi:MAG TPA: hypothetical protein VJA16_19780, partial [Thermoanaerobaculia bacterium]
MAVPTFTPQSPLAAMAALLAALITLGGCATTLPRLPAPKPVADCAVGGLPPPPASGPALVLDASVKGGVYGAPAVDIPANASLQLTSDLLVIATRDITILGLITGPQGGAARIVFVSLEGTIRVGNQASIGLGFARPGPASTPRGASVFALGGPGENGGLLKLVALKGSVDIAGTLFGQAGGPGGLAKATASPLLARLQRAFGFVPQAGAALAMGGVPGAGGDVIVCA